MKLATWRQGGRDGTLVLVNRSLERALPVPDIAQTLQQVMDNWAELSPKLSARAAEFEKKDMPGQVKFSGLELASPLPRAYQWVDGSAYLNHVELVRKARGAELPPEFLHDPLVYQGGSDAFLGPKDPIELADEAWGIDFESEVTVVTDDVPMGISAADALKHIRLVMLVNDVSLRNLIPAELAKGFGFYQSKPASAFSPVAVTPDELGPAWREGKVHLPLRTHWNEKLVGQPNAGVDMQFSFPQLIAHIAKTRHLAAGTILGSGTVSNRDRKTGYSCIQEQRMLEKIEFNEFRTPFMRFGDRVRVEMQDAEGQSIFGAIEQVVERYTK